MGHASGVCCTLDAPCNMKMKENVPNLERDVLHGIPPSVECKKALDNCNDIKTPRVGKTMENHKYLALAMLEK